MVAAEVRNVVPGVVGELESFDLAREQAKMTVDAARAFTVWLGLSDRRLDVAAAHAGHSHDTVRQWSTKYRWREIAARYDLAVSSALMVQLRSTLVVEGFRSIQRVMEIRDAPIDGRTIKASDVLKASFWVASLTGIGSELAQGESATGGGLSREDLRKLATSGDPDDLKRLVRLTTGADREDRS